jgi:hypothetical protein
MRQESLSRERIGEDADVGELGEAADEQPRGRGE